MKQFSLNGVVTPYTGNGRRLGFPTANIPIPADTPEGLFIGHVVLAEKHLPALIFIGAPITLNDPEKRAEAYILDFADRDLYGEPVEFIIEHKLRDNHKYVDEATLITQMEQDEQDARAYFKDKGN